MKQRYLDIAIEAAKAAGKLLLERMPNATVKSSNDKDIKLKEDEDAERLIIDILNQETAFNIISEETGFIDNDTSMKWIIDPLDGTYNYKRGIPSFCVSIALWENDAPVLGVIYDFYYDNLYTGIIGEGAWWNSFDMKVSELSDISQSVIFTGFPVYTSFESDSIKTFIENVQQFKKIRMIGSAALAIVSVAKGIAECYQEQNTAIWDVAAGIAIVEAAGGKIERTSGTESHLLNIKATNGRI